MFEGGLFIDIGVVIVAAAGLSFLAHRLKQPLIIAYILTGLLIGPGLLNLTPDADVFDTLADIGVAFLLFIVGLNLNWKNIREVGWIALATGVGQVVFTSGIGYFISHALGYEPMTSIYLGVAFAFSSTIIVVKLLSDKEDLDRLYGRISVGFLIVQDLMAMFILLFLGSVRSGTDLSTLLSVTLVRWIVVLVILAVLSLWILPKIAAYAARSQELLFLFGLAWCFGLAAALSILGFGIEIGALLAGLSLAGTLPSQEMSTRIKPLRDFFLIIFFITLGTQLDIGGFSALVFPAAVWAAFILIGNPLIVMLIMRTLGYHPRTGFLAGTTVAQISEFSFIVLAAGIAVGHIPGNILPLATVVGLFTIAVSSYMMMYNDALYRHLAFLFRWLEPKHLSHRATEDRDVFASVFLFGFHRMGEVILPKMRALRERYQVVDFDPYVIHQLREKGVPAIYGDVSDPEFLQELRVDRARMIVSTIPDQGISLSILNFLKRRGFKGAAIVTVKSAEQAAACYTAGATFVIIPSILGGQRFGELLAKERTSRARWSKLAKT